MLWNFWRMSIMKSVKNFITKLYPFFLGFLIIILNLIDALYTKYVVELGLCEEINYVMLFLIENYGMDSAMLIKMIIVCVIVSRLITVFEYKTVRIGMWFITLFYTLLCSYHLYTFIILTKMGLL